MSLLRRGSIAASGGATLSEVILGISDIKGYWKMDDGSGTNVNDYGSGGHDGTLVACEWAAGLGNRPNRAVKFMHTSNGSDGFTVAHHADFNVSAAWSLVQCVRSWGQEGAGLWFSLSGSNSPRGDGSIVSSQQRPTITDGANNVVCAPTSGIADIDQWHLVIRTWNGTTAKIYIDGVDVSGSTTPPSPAYADSSGVFETSGPYTRWVQAHVALYGKALSTGEVASLAAAFNAEKNGTPLPTLKIGIHQNLTGNGTAGQRQNAIARVRAVHATVSRNQMYWDQIEPTENNFDWTRHDAVLAEVLAGDMEMLATIASSPTWANGGGDTWQVPGTGVDASFNTWLGHYEDYVTALVTRYADDIHMWELWNEPNLLGFWSNGSNAVDAAQYRAWYNAIRAAILAVDADALVSFAGVTSWSGAGGSDQAGETFFRNCMAAGAMTIDHFAYHPYVSTTYPDPDTFVGAFDNTYYGDIRAIRDVLLEFGYDVPIWLTEFGWPSSGGGHTETTQRDRLQNALEGIPARLADIVEMAIVFQDFDQGGFFDGLYSDMPSNGDPPTAKLAAAMYSAFAASYDV